MSPAKKLVLVDCRACRELQIKRHILEVILYLFVKDRVSPKGKASPVKMEHLIIFYISPCIVCVNLVIKAKLKANQKVQFVSKNDIFKEAHERGILATCY